MEWMENIHTQRCDLLEHADGELQPDTCVSLAALSRVEGERFEAWAVDPNTPGRLTHMCVRHTPLLTGIHAALRAAARPVNEVEEAVLPPATTGPERAVFRSFLAHLVRLGVLQLSKAPQRRRTGWHAPGSEPSPAGDALPIDARWRATGFLDVYRRATGTLSADSCLRLQRRLEQALRVHALIDADAGDVAHGVLDRVTADSCPILDVFGAWLRATNSAWSADRGGRKAGATAHWPPAGKPGSGYQRLLDWMSTRIEAGAALDITPDLLDALRAPERKLGWPLDCLVRPLGSGEAAALDMMAPAGVLDARFIGALERLHERDVPHAAAYRSFVERLEQETGLELVEVLVPSLSERAANAVRRPLYTSAWTGDADLRTYCDVGESSPRFLPLGDLTVRRTGARLAIEADGKPIRPVYHATRTPPPPWDLLMKILLHGSRQQSCWLRRLRHSLGAFPSRDFVPRITIGGSLLLSPAQWRLTPDQLWDSAASGLDKACSLLRLRDRLELSRWVFVSSGVGEPSRPCDLESLRAFPVLEQAARGAGSTGMVIEEMVPAVGDLTTSDAMAGTGTAVATQLMLRFPYDERPTAMAVRVADELAAIDSNLETREGGEDDGAPRGGPVELCDAGRAG